MEIDFLGLKSPKFIIKQQSSSYSETDTSGGGGVETSLSLSTTSTTSLDCYHRDILNFSEEKNRTWKLPNEDTELQHSPCLVRKPVFHCFTTTRFPFDLNQNSSHLRNTYEIPDEPASLAITYSGTANVFDDTLPAQKAESAVRMSGKAKSEISNGDSPTVAMARRATLARFLEKRSHRMNEARTSHVIGKSLNDAIKNGKK